MARLSPIEELRLLTKVSKLYYEEDLNQDAIMEKLQLSRAKVSRLLKEARDRGIVKISVSPPPEIHPDLEVRLENRFGLKEAIVVEVSHPNSQDVVARELGVAASNYIQRILKNGDVLGISWGTTLNYMVSAMQSEAMPDVQVVQVIGGLGPAESEMHATDLCRRLARTLGCKLSLLPAPGIVKNVDIKNVYLMDSYVQKAMSAFANLTITVLGIGAPTPNSVMMRDGEIITKEELGDLLNRGVIGDIALRFFDVEGNPVESEMNERVIGVSLEELSHVQRVVGVAGGAEKETVIRAALLGKLVNVLITDHLTAHRLLENWFQIQKVTLIMESKLNPEEILLLAGQVIERESSAVRTIIPQLDHHFVEAAQMLLDCQGHVLTAGSGTSHAVALRLAHLLSCCGTPALFIHPGDAQHGLSGAVTSRDVLMVISKGGTTTEVNQLVHIAKRRGAKVIAVTEKPNSPMSEMCDVVLKVVSPEGVDMYGMIATGSSLVNSAFGDALCIVMATLRNYSQSQFGETHPGGAVGEKLKQA